MKTHFNLRGSESAELLPRESSSKHGYIRVERVEYRTAVSHHQDPSIVVYDDEAILSIDPTTPMKFF